MMTQGLPEPPVQMRVAFVVVPDYHGAPLLHSLKGLSNRVWALGLGLFEDSDVRREDEPAESAPLDPEHSQNPNDCRDRQRENDHE